MNRIENCICLTSEVENAQWAKDHTYVCPICGNTFTGYGNNPYPIATSGICCDECNTWVIMIRCWLNNNHDWLKGLVNELSRKQCANTGYCYAYEHTVAFTFYKDTDTKKLAVVVCCDDKYTEAIIAGALQNWIIDNCSDKNLKGITSWGKDIIRFCTAQKKNEFDLETRESA